MSAITSDLQLEDSHLLIPDFEHAYFVEQSFTKAIFYLPKQLYQSKLEITMVQQYTIERGPAGLF